MSTPEIVDNILYVKSINSEWRLDAETVFQPFKERYASLAEIQSKGSAWSYLSSFTLSKYNLDCQSPEISNLIDAQPSWRIVLSNSKDKLAILQNHHIEIRSADNDFTETLYRWILPSSDLFLQWRNLAWSPCDEMLAFSDIRGNVFLYSKTGDQLSHVVQPKSQSCDLGNAVCGLIFKERNSKDHNIVDDYQHWVHELRVITYQGLLTTFMISQEGDHRQLHTFNFENGYLNGVTDAVFVPTSSLLIVGGGTFWKHGMLAEDETSKQGITAWRLLSEYPHYKLVSDYEFECATVGLKTFSSSKKWWSWSTNQTSDKVFKMAVSPDCKTLASVHSSENICIWSLPSLKLLKKFSLVDQPDRDYIDPDILENPKKKKAFKDLLNAFYVVSLAWWSNEDIILSRGTGCLTVSNIKDLINRLGSTPEFFESETHLMRLSDGCFYILECQKKHGSSKRDVAINDREESIEEMNHQIAGAGNDDDDDDEGSGVTTSAKFMSLFWQGLYYVTEFDTLQPPKKKSRMVRRTYRLICLKSTTPEELYSNMLDGEEYGEALLLARKYNLDCDLTYQRQWKKSHVTVSSIQDYLRKITKRSWVLHECLETVPSDLEAMEELLRYGLRGTDLEAVAAAGRDDDDDSRFIFCESYDEYKSLNHDDDTVDDDDDDTRVKEEKRRKEFLEQIDFDNLNFNQKELCRARLKLLQYLDKLETYQEILGGKHLAPEKYDKLFFKKFRKENIVRSALELAHLSDVHALESLFSYHGSDVLPHRLPILSNIPETTMADVFAHLLPKICLQETERKVECWDVLVWRSDPDWSEQLCSNLISVIPDDDPGKFLYEEQPELLEFRGRSLSEEQLTSWFRRRSLEIEKLSGQVDCACALLGVGIKNNIQGLETLYEDFKLMEMLVYDCHSPLSFDCLVKMTTMERLHRMMAKTNRDMFLKNITRWVVPYLKQQESKSPGSYYSLLGQYLVEMAIDDLTYVEIIFKSNNAVKSDAIIGDVHQLFSIADDCLYAHTGTDQLCMIKTIIQCLPELDDCPKENEMKSVMACHLLGAEILKKNGIEQTMFQIRDIQNSESNAVKIFTRLARISAKKTPPMSQSELELLLTDMCVLQKNVFKNTSMTKIYEIFVGALLCSGNESHISLAGKVMESSLNPTDQSRPPPKTSVRTTIKDSLKSLTTTRISPPPTSSNSSFISSCTISRSQSIQLILQAAREYFNSSPDFLHDNMELAKSCLNLVKDKPSEVQVELNLIEALAMLKHHGISEFPAHLRICEDRLKYIKHVLKKKIMMYKNYSKLLELGKLLNIAKGDERILQGEIFELIAQHALEAKDYSVCLDSCKKLMSLKYEEGWNVCKSLAEDSNYHDDLAKFNLFNFVLLYSPDCHISEILESLSKLQFKALCEEFTKNMASSSEPSSVHQSQESSGSMKVLIGQTKQVLNLTRVAFDRIGDTRWWSGVVNHAATGLKRLAASGNKHKSNKLGMFIRSRSSDRESGSYLTRQTFHPFYNSLNNQSHSGVDEAAEWKEVYMGDPLVDVNQLLLQIYLLNGGGDDNDHVGSGDDYDNDAGKSTELITQVLLSLAENAMPRDTSLGMSYLLAVPDAFEAEKCFDRLPKTPFCYHLAMYFFALKVAHELSTVGIELHPDVYVVPPRSLIREVEMKAGDSNLSNKILFERMFHYRSLLGDFQESETLKNMERGIDTTRFTSDESYKKETILGMALSLDDQLLSSALQLASKYQLRKRDVYMAHLSFLFDDSSCLTTEEIEKRIRDLKMLAILNEDPIWFSRKMQEEIFPLIEGVDLNRLLVYYTCLVAENEDNEKENVSEKSSESISLRPQMHVKMLRKLKNVAIGVNYKDLFQGKYDMEVVLSDVINSNNVAVFAKYSNYFSDKKGRTISPDFVYKCLASKIFNTSVNEQNDWMERYKASMDSIQSLTPEVLIEFVDENLFGIKAIKKIPVESRKQIMKGIMKHSKQQLTQAKKTNQHLTKCWHEAVQILQKYIDHMNKISSKMISRMYMSDNVAWQQYAADYDLTRSRNDEVKILLKRMVLAGETVEFVEDFMKNISIENLSCQCLYIEVLQELCSTFEENESHFPLQKIKDVLNEISKQNNSRGGSVINLKDVCIHLKDVVSNSDVDPHFKLQILSVIKENSPLKDDNNDILYSQTCAILSMMDHHGDQLTPERISQEPERIVIFKGLLESLTSADKLLNLAHLLDIWPPLENSSENLWYALLKKLIITSNDDILQQILQLFNDAKDRLNEKEILELSNLMMPRDPLSACKILLSSSDETLTDRALSILMSLPTDTKDERLFIVLLDRRMLPRCTNLPFYCNLLDFMMTCDFDSHSSQTIETSQGMILEALKDLTSSGQKCEAGTLYMSWKSVHRGLRTFDAAINFVDKFLSK